MFYSHTFLARKSPLGTVWIAAHLERRIKKSQIDVIHIPSYAECIMFPEVPIALRLSGHLLLGLVRIYSWKVNYLFQDCNRMLTNMRMFTSIQVDLPADANHAPFESVTLPNTFELDAVELDDTCYQTDGPDNHLRAYEEITLTDPVSDEAGSYVAFFINEDDQVNIPFQPEISSFGVQPMEEDVVPSTEGYLEAIATPIENIRDVGGPDLGNQAESFSKSLSEGYLSQGFPEIEVMRDAVDSFDPVNIAGPGDTSNGNDRLHEHSIPTNRKGSLSPIMEAGSVSGLLPSPLRDNAPTIPSLDDPEIANTEISLGQPLPDFELQPSPSIEKQKAKRRKRKQFFDESIVLSNADMKKQLEDTSKLVCKRRKLPCSALDAWRFHMNLRKECVFHEPLLSGMCSNLKEAFQKKFSLLSVDSTLLEPSPGPSNAQSHYAMPDIDMEPEQPRFDSHIDGNMLNTMPSPSVREEFSPFNTSNLGSVSDMGKAIMTETLPTLEMTAISEPVGMEPATPLDHLEEQRPLDNTDLVEIPGLLSSANGEDLIFLEASNASSDYEAVSVDNMSARTRAVAQYLREHSPATQILEDQAGKLSLNRILEGKTRKQCARMFYETLVLKSYGLINVEQEEAYGDIKISRTPTLSTAKF